MLDINCGAPVGAALWDNGVPSVGAYRQMKTNARHGSVIKTRIRVYVGTKRKVELG
jgi:hypothetical protein